MTGAKLDKPKSSIRPGYGKTFKREVPSNYLVDGLRVTSYDKIRSSRKGADCEAVKYKTPNGTEFSLAKDFMGIQFCKGGRFWPYFFSWPSMEEAVDHLKANVNSAIAFFDNI